MCSQTWTPLPLPNPYHFSGSSACTSPKHPVSCIKHRLVIRFLHDSIHVSMPFSQITPPSPSPTESKSPFYTSVSLCIFKSQFYCSRSCCSVAQSCLTLCDQWTVACQAPLSMGILQARILCSIQDTGCLGLVHGDDPERWYGMGGGGGFMFGNSCTPVVDSCQCMAKPIQYCKVK